MLTKRSLSRAYLVAVTLALSGALAACASTSASSSSKAGSSGSASTKAKARLTGNLKIVISNYSYHPTTINVTAGTKVTFTNDDQTAHTATSTKTGFDTGTVQPGHSATVVLTKPGTYTYYCQFHAFMHGTIIVR